jgi:hypothetical protein
MLVLILDESGYTQDPKLVPTLNQSRSIRWLLKRLNGNNPDSQGAVIADALGSCV